MVVYLRIIISLEFKQLSIFLKNISKIGDNYHIEEYESNKNLIVAISTSRNEMQKNELFFANAP